MVYFLFIYLYSGIGLFFSILQSFFLVLLSLVSRIIVDYALGFAFQTWVSSPWALVLYAALSSSLTYLCIFVGSLYLTIFYYKKAFYTKIACLIVSSKVRLLRSIDSSVCFHALTLLTVCSQFDLAVVLGHVVSNSFI